jgi:hypothetical protein
MKKTVMSAVVYTTVIGTLNLASATDNGLNIIDDIKFSGQIRPRYEFADKKDNSVDAANAFTARVRLAVEAKLFNVDALKAKIGVTSINNFGYTDYNDGSASGNTKYDKIVDAQQAILSEAYLSYTLSDTNILAGRSHINLDNQRFIGTVGWRQMERAYDTLTVTNKSVKNLTLLGSWIYGYQGVNSKPTTETSSAILHANYKLNDMFNATAFSYILADVHNTYGLRATGAIPIGNDIKLNYAASYAKQAKASINYNGTANADIDASYIDLAVNTKINAYTIGLEYEKLGKAEGTSTKGFTTPLATLHKFQGFADEFLAQTGGSNDLGLRDISVKVGYATKNSGKALVIYHKFFAEAGANKDFGSEIDVLYARAIPGLAGVKGLVKAAYYMSKDQGIGHDNDNAKAWVQADYKF